MVLLPSTLPISTVRNFPLSTRPESCNQRQLSGTIGSKQLYRITDSDKYHILTGCGNYNLPWHIYQRGLSGRKYWEWQMRREWRSRLTYGLLTEGAEWEQGLQKERERESDRGRQRRLQATEALDRGGLTKEREWKRSSKINSCCILGILLPPNFSQLIEQTTSPPVILEQALASNWQKTLSPTHNNITSDHPITSRG